MLRDITTPIYETIYLPEHHEVRLFISYSPGDYTVSHWHDAVEIIYIYQGDLTVHMAGQDYELTEDTFLLINSKVIHATQCFHENHALVIQIPQSFLKHNIPDIDNLMFRIPYNSEQSAEQDKIRQIKKLLHEMYTINQVQSNGIKLKMNSLIYELIYILYCDFRMEVTQTAFLKHTKNLSILTKVMNYSKENHASEITIDEIAEVAGFQPKYFCRFFKNNVGYPYLFYLNHLRIQFIYQDLVETDLPIYQILEKHGFTNYKLFRQMFYERFHDTPRNIRKSEKR